MSNKIEPILIDVDPMFRFNSENGWAIQYDVLIGDNRTKEFSFKKMRAVPARLGYNFWLLVRSQGFSEANTDIDANDMRQALVMDHEDTQKVVDYLAAKINIMGTVTWDEFKTKASEILDVSDIDDDAAADN
jgi:hypothetical protein